MIFINNAIQKIGKDCLIVNLKAKNFFEGEGLRKEDFEQLFEVLKGDHNLNIPISKKIVYYFVFYIMNMMIMMKPKQC